MVLVKYLYLRSTCCSESVIYTMNRLCF